LLRHPAALLVCCLRLCQRGPPILRPYCIDPQVCLCCFDVHCLVRWLYAILRVCQPYLWQRFCKFIHTSAYSELGQYIPEVLPLHNQRSVGDCKSAAPLRKIRVQKRLGAPASAPHHTQTVMLHGRVATQRIEVHGERAWASGASEVPSPIMAQLSHVSAWQCAPSAVSLRRTPQPFLGARVPVVTPRNARRYVR